MIQRSFNMNTKWNTAHRHTHKRERQMWATTRGLRLFIMKGIHHSVPALPLSTQFSHWASLPPSCLPFYLFLFFPTLALSILNPVWGWSRTGCVGESEKWMGEWLKRTDLQDSLGSSVGPCLSLLPPRLSPGRGLCGQEHLLYLGICGAPLGGWGSATGFSTSLAARQSAQCASSCLLDCGGHAGQPAQPPRTVVRAESRWLREAQETHVA